MAFSAQQAREQVETRQGEVHVGQGGCVRAEVDHFWQGRRDVEERAQGGQGDVGVASDERGQVAREENARNESADVGQRNEGRLQVAADE